MNQAARNAIRCLWQCFIYGNCLRANSQCQRCLLPQLLPLLPPPESETVPTIPSVLNINSSSLQTHRQRSAVLLRKLPVLFLFFSFCPPKNSSYDLTALKEQRREESMPFHSLHAFHLFQTVSDHKVKIVITDKVNIHLYAQHCSVGSSTSNDIREDEEKVQPYLPSKKKR